MEWIINFSDNKRPSYAYTRCLHVIYGHITGARVKDSRSRADLESGRHSSIEIVLSQNPRDVPPVNDIIDGAKNKKRPYLQAH